jgi:serine/threonine-protein kinase
MGKYVLVASLAKGGMAEIWLARQSGPTGFDRPVVVKRILSADDGDDDFVRMFLDEARIASQLSHPNIVQIIELDVAQGRYFIAMEYLHGETLSHVVRSSQSRGLELPLAVSGYLVCEAAAGIGYAHSRKSHAGQPLGIVHRDVSPQNILVTYDGQVKVVDFGIAKAKQRSSKTMKGVVKGKTAYMAPEQARGESVDPRADVFALGVVLFEAVTGTRLHGEMEDPAIVARLLSNQPLPPASSRKASLPKELDAIIARALAHDVEARYPDGQTFQLALRRWLQTLPGPLPTASEVDVLMHRLFAERIAQRQELLVREPPPPEGPERGPSDARITVPDRIPAAAELGEVTDSTWAEDPAAPSPRAFAWKRVLLRTSVLFLAGFGIVYGVLNSNPSPPDAVQVLTPAPAPKIVRFPDVPALPIAQGPALAPTVDAGNGRATPGKPALNKGKLSLDTEPWTQVYLGKKFLGDTPLVEKKLPVGKHTLKLVNESEGIDSQIEVIIKGDEVTTKSLKL